MLGAARRDADAPTIGDAVSPAVETSIVYTPEPTFFDKVTLVALRVLRGISKFIGVDLYGQIGKLLSSASPPWFVKFGLDVRRTEFAVSEDNVWKVWEFHPPNPTGKTVIAVHGGGFILEPILLHWIDYSNMARETGATVLVPMYPLATTTDGTATKVVPAMAQYISAQIDRYGADNVSLYGDSAGAILAAVAVRELILAGRPVPASMVLISIDPRRVAVQPGHPDHRRPGLRPRQPRLLRRREPLEPRPRPPGPDAQPAVLRGRGDRRATADDDLSVGALEYVAARHFVAARQVVGRRRGGLDGGRAGPDPRLGARRDADQLGGPMKVRPDIYRQLGLNDVARRAPKTITTAPPSSGDQFIVGLLRTLRWLNDVTGIKILSGIAGGVHQHRLPRGC